MQRLRELTGGISYQFLGFTLDLQDGVITDNFAQTSKYSSEWSIRLLSTLLTHYSTTKKVPLVGKLIKFKDLPGGCAYESAFIERAILPVAYVFGSKPDELPKAAQLLGGTTLKIGDASTEIPALKCIPLTYVLYGKEEFPASANILYDQTASSHLPTEDLAVLGEITTERLIDGKKRLTT